MPDDLIVYDGQFEKLTGCTFVGGKVLALVEGIDPINSGTFQALQSYRYEDIVWEPHSQFAPCLTVVDKPNRKEQIYSVDLERYHDIVVDLEAQAAALEAAALETAETSHQAALNGEVTAQQQPANNNAKATRKRHRRIKTLSSRTSDSLFTSDQHPCSNAVLKQPQQNSEPTSPSSLIQNI